MTSERASSRWQTYLGRVSPSSHNVQQTLLILGASGDLTKRLLLPGLGGLLTSREEGRLLLIGAGREGWDDNDWRKRVADSFSKGNATGPTVDRILERTRYLQADVTREDDMRRLLSVSGGRIIVYFALPPPVTLDACRVLTAVQLPPETRLVMEKPFGTDAASAAALNDLLVRLVPEDQIYRVDHFLGMSTVLNILGLRFSNRMLESVLNAEHVETVDIIYDESLGLEGRAGYYDGAGALVDMTQSHLLQVLALVAMEAPSTLQERDFRDAKAQVLRATHVWEDDPRSWSHRARYTAGEIEGRVLISYLDEEGIDPARRTETLAEVVFAVDTWRWAGVPFRLRSGKALNPVRKEVVITFKQPPWVPTGLSGYEQPDRLRVGLQPNRMWLDLNINGPADPFILDRVTLEASFDPGELPEYGQVLAGVLEGDPTLSVRGDTAVECWRIVEPVLNAWRNDQVQLEEYKAGSSGPAGWWLS